MLTIGRIREAIERYDFLVRFFEPDEKFVGEYHERVKRLKEVILQECHLGPKEAARAFKMHCHLSGNVLREFEALTMWFDNGVRTNHCPKIRAVEISGKPA